MSYSASYAIFYALFLPGDSSEKRPLAIIREWASKRVAQLVAKRADTWQLSHIGLERQLFGRVSARAGAPALSIYIYGRVYLVHLLAYEVHRLNVVHAHKVHPETINMIFRDPIFHALDHELAHQGLLRGCLVAAPGAVRISAVRILSIIIIGVSALEIAAVYIESMIVYHVQENFDTGLVQCLYHLFELAHTGRGVVGVGGIRTLGHIVVERVVSPIVLRAVQLSLVHRGVIIRWQDVHGIDTQHTQVLYGAWLRECQKLAFVTQS